MDNEKMWTVLQPEELGTFPKKLSFSTLNEIEACPRKFALSKGKYPLLWSRLGYPSKPSLKALEGIIVHRSIEEIIKSLVDANCSSINEEQFVVSMRELKGYSGVFDRQIVRLSKELSDNPRLSQPVSQLIEKIKLSAPTLREELQNQISKLKFEARGRAKSFSKSAGTSRTLASGTYSEVELNARELGWFGKIDYLIVSPDGCEIVDIKTGVPKTDHAFQIKIYNLLWLLDRERNPDFIPVTKLLLSYNHEDANIQPLTADEAEDFAEQLQARTEAVRIQLSKDCPTAVPSPENCGFCSVRQLCADYWNQETQIQLEQTKTERSIFGKKNIDLEVQLENSVAAHIWHAKVLVCGSIESDRQILLRFSPDDTRFIPKLEPEEKLRLIDVYTMQQSDEEDSKLTINFYWQSEAFKV